VKRTFLFPSFELSHCITAIAPGFSIRLAAGDLQSRNGCGRYSDAPLMPAIAVGCRVSFLNCIQRLRIMAFTVIEMERKKALNLFRPSQYDNKSTTASVVNFFLIF
jgi:hypothetical protein